MSEKLWKILTKNIMKKNKNIVPLVLNDLAGEVEYSKFEYKNFFIHSCNLIPEKEKERIRIKIIDEIIFKKKGVVYLFIVNGKVLKIGQTTTTIKKRIQSYNCGKVEYRINGTNSTTNYFILQSILKINKTVEVYTYQPDKPEINVFGKIIKTNTPVTKMVEKQIIKDFIKKFGKKPVGLTQK